MENRETKAIEMTAEEQAQFEQFKRDQAAKSAAEKEREDRLAYRQLVNELVNTSSKNLETVSFEIAKAKKAVLEEFKKAIDMKAQLFGIEKLEQYSHTFINETGDTRITIGQHTMDDYRDTVNEGIAIVQQSIKNLARDDNSRALVEAVLRLLSRNKQGALKASRVIQLRKIAEESKNTELLRGVQIIEDAYNPTPSSVYIRMERKNGDKKWLPVPLGMTES
jgi:hypothetical protein